MYYTYYIVFCINTVRIIGRHNTADRSRSRAAASCRAAREAESPMLNLVTTPTTVTATMAAAAETRRLDIEAMHAKALSIFNTIKANPNVTFAKKHSVDFYVNVVNTNPNNKQQMKGNCMCCSREIASTGSFKFTEHLTKCSLCPREVRNAFIALNEKTDGKRAEKHDLERMATKEAQLAAQDHEQRQAQLKQQCIKAGIKQSEVNAADLAIANFFYANAIPFSVASDQPDSLYRKMVSAIQAAPSGYVPPRLTKLSGPLLDYSYNDMWAKLHARDPDGTLKSKFGSCYVSDGWESCDNLPLINSAFISANDGGTYWRSVDTSGKTKSAEYCALLMIQDIYDFGPTNVILVITDTCNTMAKAWAIVQDEFPWISFLPCQPHVIALLMKDIAKEKEVKDVINEEATVVGWFSNHQFPLAKLRETTLAMLGSACELIKAGATRFGTHTLVGERLLKLKAALQRTVVDPDYLAAKYKDATDTEEATGTGRVFRTNKGATTSKLVQDEDGFWARVSTHVDVTKPIFRMLRRFDSSAPAIGKVYSSWFELGEHLGSAASPYQAKCLEKHAERWAYGHSDIAAAAYVLDPEFHEHGQAENEEVTTGFYNVVEKRSGSCSRCGRMSAPTSHCGRRVLSSSRTTRTSWRRMTSSPPTPPPRTLGSSSARRSTRSSPSIAPRRARFRAHGSWQVPSRCPPTCGGTPTVRAAPSCSAWRVLSSPSLPRPLSASASTLSSRSSRTGGATGCSTTRQTSSWPSSTTSASSHA
jgi:hypothetical protein